LKAGNSRILRGTKDENVMEEWRNKKQNYQKRLYPAPLGGKSASRKKNRTQEGKGNVYEEDRLNCKTKKTLFTLLGENGQKGGWRNRCQRTFWRGEKGCP